MLRNLKLVNNLIQNLVFKFLQIIHVVHYITLTLPKNIKCTKKYIILVYCGRIAPFEFPGSDECLALLLDVSCFIENHWNVVGEA